MRGSGIRSLCCTTVVQEDVQVSGGGATVYRRNTQTRTQNDGCLSGTAQQSVVGMIVVLVLIMIA